MTTETNQTNTTANNSSTEQGQFSIKKICVKYQSGKVPHTPGIYQQEGKPDTQLELNLQNRP